MQATADHLQAIARRTADHLQAMARRTADHLQAIARRTASACRSYLFRYWVDFNSVRYFLGGGSQRCRRPKNFLKPDSKYFVSRDKGEGEFFE